MKKKILLSIFFFGTLIYLLQFEGVGPVATDYNVSISCIATELIYTPPDFERTSPNTPQQTLLSLNTTTSVGVVLHPDIFLIHRIIYAQLKQIEIRTLNFIHPSSAQKFHNCQFISGDDEPAFLC
ncbi:MAG: hypothetical protein DWQ05_17855 [Calditrichaeota bacterium]|nr:MAG: hypothetical protein DWQ05_17855 [Calditrichota bacterium]